MISTMLYLSCTVHRISPVATHQAHRAGPDCYCTTVEIMAEIARVRVCMRCRHFISDSATCYSLQISLCGISPAFSSLIMSGRVWRIVIGQVYWLKVQCYTSVTVDITANPNRRPSSVNPHPHISLAAHLA